MNVDRPFALNTLTALCRRDPRSFIIHCAETFSKAAANSCYRRRRKEEGGVRIDSQGQTKDEDRGHTSFFAADIRYNKRCNVIRSRFSKLVDPRRCSNEQRGLSALSWSR